MTLGEVLARSRTPPEVGDHEVVTGSDGLAHIIVLTRNENKDYRAALEFMCACGALIKGDPMGFEVAPSITCMKCMLL